MKIALGGKAGSGKSTVAKAIAQEFKLKHYSTGDLMRSLAQKAGLKIEQFVKDRPKEADSQVDERTKKIGREEDNFIFDSRLAFHFLPGSIKVFLDVKTKTAAQRIMKDQRESETEHISIEDTIKKIEKRWNDSREKYIDFYKVDMQDKSNYDLYLDTTNLTLEEVIKKVKEFILQSLS
jgi:CMP/dCMP kinase